MNKQILISQVGLFALLVIAGCKKAERGPIQNDKRAPAPVSNIQVLNLSGAAKLTYTLPKDPDLLYVKAVYKDDDGTEREFKASNYGNTITLNGFGSAAPYEVKLYAVDEGENASSPVTVTVEPTTPPYLITRHSLEAKVDFGGIKVSYTNPDKGDLAIVVLTKDDRDRLRPYNTAYTNLEAGTFATRGLPSKPTEFGIFVRDRWGHLSDTLQITVTPFLEVELDKKLFKAEVLPGDAKLGYGGSIPNLFNNNYNDAGYHTGDGGVMPSWFTVNLGKKAKISRLVWWMRRQSDQFSYGLHNPRNVEIYGSNNPNPDGSWDNSWTLLAVHEQIKPSGLPLGQVSQADKDAATAGETVEISAQFPAFQYIRFKTLRNWSGGSYVNFLEMALFGQPE